MHRFPDTAGFGQKVQEAEPTTWCIPRRRRARWPRTTSACRWTSASAEAPPSGSVAAGGGASPLYWLASPEHDKEPHGRVVRDHQRRRSPLAHAAGLSGTHRGQPAAHDPDGRRRRAPAPARQDAQAAAGDRDEARRRHPQVQGLHHRRGRDDGRRRRARDILLAYQPVGPNPARLVEPQRFPGHALLQHRRRPANLARIGAVASAAGVTIPLYVDLDVGMHRTGIAPGDAAMALVPRTVAHGRRAGGRPACLRRLCPRGRCRRAGGGDRAQLRAGVAMREQLRAEGFRCPT